MLSIDLTHLDPFISCEDKEPLLPQAEVARRNLLTGKGPGAHYLGWYDLPLNYDREEFLRIQAAASKIRDDSEVLLVAGIGGSYLGARAVIEALSPHFIDARWRHQRQVPEILFVGNNLNSGYLQDLLTYVGERDFSLNVISKSGGTLETALAFRILREKLEERYGERARDRIYVTTDKSRGLLRNLVRDVGYESFVIPDNIGGRYSVLTAVGLLPMAVAGLDLELLMEGAQACKLNFERQKLESMPMAYALARHILYRAGYGLEVLAAFEPRLEQFGKWWQQLFAESEGKQHRGIYPASLTFSTDLHSVGQYLQEGRRFLFETFLYILDDDRDILIPDEAADMDQLNYLSGTSLSQIQRTAYHATAMAHADGGLPNLSIYLERRDAYHLGALIFFFETACALSAYLNEVNPFDQPGVEAYKKNMFALLGKPGCEELGQQLRARLYGTD